MKLNKKGFTLIEVLSVIAIIAVVAVIVAPMTLSVIDRVKENKYDYQISQIKEAAVMYVADYSSSNLDLSTVGSTHYVNLQTLSDLGYIDTPISNPLTGEAFDEDCFTIAITRGANNTFTYDVYSYDTCGDTPRLILNGSNPATVACSATGTYTDPKAKVIDNLNPTAEDISATNTLALKNGGTYSVHYQYTNSKNATTSIDRVVNITNSNTPTLTVAGNVTSITINVGDTLTVPTATSTDNCDGTITVGITSNVVPNVAGTYHLIYKATNSGGISNTKTVTVTVSSANITAFDYTGAPQTFTVPTTGTYKIELWGAAGGDTTTGNGGYTSGQISLTSGTTLYVYVGQAGTAGIAAGNAAASTTDNAPTYNGGGGGARGGTYNSSGYDQGNSGGGATDIRLVNGTWSTLSSLVSRIMVAGGGGAKGNRSLAGEGGTLTGSLVTSETYVGETYYSGTGGSQTGGGTPGYTSMTSFSYAGVAGTLGVGGNGGQYATTHTYGEGGAGAGGGFFGGAGGANSHYNVSSSSGGGGSSYISGHTGCNSVNSSGVNTGSATHYSGYAFTSDVMIDGTGYAWTTTKGSQTQMPSKTTVGTYYATGVGNAGNGYARITFIG